MLSSSVARLPPRVLVLWDLDHTLIEARGVGFGIYRRAFKAATGKDMRQLASLSGRTELDIAVEALRSNGLEPTDEAIGELMSALTDGYQAARSELATRGRALPGAQETLALLAEDPTIYQSLLTGNSKEVARIKVETFGLARYLDLDAGAYGEDDHDRAKLVQRAQQRAQASTGMVFTSNRTVLIGDTPNDVRAATAAGAHIIGVATGKSSDDELRRAGAEHVVADLRDSAHVRRLIGALG